jgi:O-antigen ligase
MANLMKSKIKDINLKGIVSFLALVALAITVGYIFVRGSSDISIGFLLKIIIYSSPLVFLLCIVQIFETPGIRDIFLGWGRPDIKWSNLLLILPLAILSAFLVIYLTNQGFGLTQVSLLIFNLVSYFVALYLFVRGKPVYGISIFLLTIPFLAFLETEFAFVLHSFLSFGDVYISPTLIYLLSIFLVSLVTVKIDWEFINREKTFLIATLLFFIYPFISCLSSPEPAKSFWLTFLEIAYPLFFFFILIKSIKSWQNIRILLLSLISYLPLYLLVGFYLHSRYAEQFFGQQYLHDVYIHYYNLSSLIIAGIIIIPIVYYFSIQKRFKKFRLLFWAIITLFAVTAFLLQSRAAIYGFFFCLALLGIYAILKIKTNWMVSLGIIAVLVAVVTYVFYLSTGFLFQRFRQLSTEGLLFFDHSRMAAWKGSMAMIKDYPFFGIGAGMWDKYVASYVHYIYYGGPDIGYYYIVSPHNFYFSLATSFGLPQIVLYFFILFNLFGKYKDIVKQKIDSAGVAPYLFMSILLWLAIGITGGTFTNFFHDFGQWYRIDFTFGIIFWMIAGVITWLHSETKKKQLLTATKSQ